MSSILLRKFFDKDIELFKKWLNIPHIALWYHAPLDWVDEIEKRKSKFSFIHHFIVEKDNKAIGFCQFYEYLLGGEKWHRKTDINGAYSIDYFICETEYLGKGYGKAIVNALIEKIKMQKNAKRIIVKPEPENKASCNTLLSCDFVFDKFNEIYILNL